MGPVPAKFVAIYSDPFLRERLAFRGGTALHKLYFSPQIRYSEDIDLVQVSPEPFGPIFDHLKSALSFLPNMRRVQKTFNNSLRFKAESTVPPDGVVHSEYQWTPKFEATHSE